MKWNKEKIKELILTDLLDDQLSDADRKEILLAIEEDAELKEFYQEAKNHLIKPFEDAGKLNPPSSVWNNIESELNKELTIQSPIEKFLYKLKTMSSPKRLAYALSAVACMVIVLSLTINTGKQTQPITYSQDEQVEYLMLLAGDAQNGNGEEGFETKIENYFL